MALPPIVPSGVSTAFIYPKQVSAGQGFGNVLGANPGNTNPPIIFEPPSQLTGCKLQVWMIATGGANWGGCQVWFSVDNMTYGQIGMILAGGIQGTLSAPFPVGSDPDRVNTLSVDLTESLASLTSVTNQIADTFLDLCYCDGELIAFSTATLTAPNQYDLQNYIRRGVYDTTIGSHASASPFGQISPGTFKQTYPPNLVGQTIYVKLPAFNTFFGQLQDLATVPAYTYTLLGTGEQNCTGTLLDDDTADMQDVVSGTVWNTVLTKVVTQVVWRSTTPGTTKLTAIPGPLVPPSTLLPGNEGYSLDIKTTVGNGDVHVITPASGTIGGMPSLRFDDARCNLSLRSDAANNDWIIRDLYCEGLTIAAPPPPPGPPGPGTGNCCISTTTLALPAIHFSADIASISTPTPTPPNVPPPPSPGPPPPPNFNPIVIDGFADGYAHLSTSVDNQHNILGTLESAFLTTHHSNTAIVAQIFMSGPVGSLPTVTNITGDVSLVWKFRGGHTSTVSAPAPIGTHDARIEEWYATNPSPLTSVQFVAHLSGTVQDVMFRTIAFVGVDLTRFWAASPDLPQFTTFSSTPTPIDTVITTTDTATTTLVIGFDHPIGGILPPSPNSSYTNVQFNYGYPGRIGAISSVGQFAGPLTTFHVIPWKVGGAPIDATAALMIVDALTAL